MSSSVLLLVVSSAPSLLCISDWIDNRRGRWATRNDTGLSPPYLIGRVPVMALTSLFYGEVHYVDDLQAIVVDPST